MAYYFYEDLKTYKDVFTNQPVLVGNSMDFFGKPNNGDVDDWVFEVRNIPSMSLYVAPASIAEFESKTVFLNADKRNQIYLRNGPLLLYLLEKSTIRIKYAL